MTHSRSGSKAYRALLAVTAALITIAAPCAAHAQYLKKLLETPASSKAATSQPAAVSSAPPPHATQPPPTTSPTRFDAADGLFALTLPPGWRMFQRQNDRNAYSGLITASNRAGFSFFTAPSEAGLTPRTILRTRRIGMEAIFKDFNVREGPVDFPLGSLKGARMIVDGTDKEGMRLRMVALVAKDDHRTFDLSFYAPVVIFDTLRPALDAMLKSFELTGTRVQAANGRFTVLLPPDVKLVQDAKQPDRQHCRLGPDAELVFDVYHASAAYNAASLMALEKKKGAANFLNYHVLQERIAPPSDVINGMINGHMLVDEWSKPDGSRWRTGSYYYDDGNFIYSFTLYAKIATFMSLWPTIAQRIATSYDGIELTAAGAQSGMRSIAGATGDFELLIPDAWVLEPATAEHVPHRFANYRACDSASVNSYPAHDGAKSADQVLEALTQAIRKSAQDVTIIEESDIKLGPLPARQRIVEFNEEDIRYRASLQCCVKDGRVYQLWLRTAAERYPFVRPVFDKMLASFTLLPPIDLTKTIPYQNKEHHFHLSYPDALHPVGTFGGEVVRLAVRPAGPAVQYLENVVVDPPSRLRDPTLTLEKAAADWEGSQMRFITGERPKGWEDTTIGGLKAKRITFDMTVKGIDGGPVLIRKMAYVIVRDGRSASIRIQGRVAAFPIFFGTAQKIIDTFEWTTDDQHDKD